MDSIIINTKNNYFYSIYSAMEKETIGKNSISLHDETLQK